MCSKLLTVKTHKVLYKFNRLPFFVKVAPNIFQQIIDTMLSGLDSAQAYLDDILVKSETQNQHAEDAKEMYLRELQITVLRWLKKNVYYVQS